MVSSLLDTLMANLNHFSRQIEDNESSYACLANFMNLVHKNKVVTKDSRSITALNVIVISHFHEFILLEHKYHHPKLHDTK